MHALLATERRSRRLRTELYCTPSSRTLQARCPMPRTARLTRADWAEAALATLVEGGAGAVAVEPVAARLGASKSSFYWLFDNRRALLEAALERWEQEQTERV